MNRPTHFAAGFFFLALVACPPALTPAGQQVGLRATKPFGCTELGTVRGPGDSVDHSAPEEATRSSHSDMRNEAAEMGANYVAIVGPDTLGTTASGLAFRCDGAPMDPPSLSAAPAPSSDPEERLKKLKDLFDKGLITKDEYDRQRAAVLQSF
jgi:hypothetical protein